MNIILKIILVILIFLSLWTAYAMVMFWWAERRAQKEFEKRQERYKKML